ncbi:MAG TPA: hypothetical protein PKD86_00695 [Gemmatales bacterium]|nr:hypothetical protein [Gemmatales bacterium]HMP57842.1 hypothetical protein [Gemmatales bacterium]
MRCAKVVGAVGVLLLFFVVGCEHKAHPTRGTPGPSGVHPKEHGPGHVHGPGPHGGVVFDLGRYHAEFTVDHAKHECTLYFLGDDETTPVAVAAKEITVHTKPTKTADGTEVPALTIKLLPKDLKEGKATLFVGTDPGLGNVADFEGTALGEINGKPAQGTFKEDGSKPDKK